MRPLVIVMMHELLGDLANLLQSGRLMDLQALLMVASVISLNGRIFIWADASGQTLGGIPRHKRKRRRRDLKIASAGTAHPSAVTIKGQRGGQARGAQEADHRIEGAIAHEKHHGAGRLPQDGGTGVDKIEHFDHVLALALGISGDRGGVGYQSIWTSCNGSRGSNG